MTPKKLHALGNVCKTFWKILSFAKITNFIQKTNALSRKSSLNTRPSLHSVTVWNFFFDFLRYFANFTEHKRKHSGPYMSDEGTTQSSLAGRSQCTNSKISPFLSLFDPLVSSIFRCLFSSLFFPCTRERILCLSDDNSPCSGEIHEDEGKVWDRSEAEQKARLWLSC